MNTSPSSGRGIPPHVIALWTLAALAVLLVLALGDFVQRGRAVEPETPRAPRFTQIAPEAWLSAQQKVLGTLTLAGAAASATLEQAQDFTAADRPIRRAITRLGVAPRQASMESGSAAPTLASLPTPGD